LRILLVHPEDTPHPWAKQKWDRIIDLSWAPRKTHSRWEAELQCPIEPFDKYCELERDMDLVRDISARGHELVDDQNINWWELFILWCVEEIQMVSSLKRFAASLHAHDQLFATRPCFEAQALGHIRNLPVHCLGKKRTVRKLQRYFQQIWSLSGRDLLQVFFDKHDENFAIRRCFARKRARAKNPVVLIPSAYVNASRTGLNFVGGMENLESLLVTTRMSGEIRGRFRNVQSASLASYVSDQSNHAEQAKIQNKWEKLEKVFAADARTSDVSSLGLLRNFPNFLRRGLAIRDAWVNVLENEPIQAVLSCDNNPDTMLPVLLAKNRGIPTVSIHHGALDWRHRFVPVHADAIIAKGKMEEDHLARICEISKEKIELGVPAKMLPEPVAGKTSCIADSIVFFSEAYEPNRVRGEEMYKEVIPHLADVAMQNLRKLIVKLHPFESVRRRKALLRKVLSPEQMRITSIVSGPLTTDLLKRTWFGVTILSTVAMECQAANVPCFMCSWLEYPHHEYGDQFRLFGVGYPLQSSDEIKKIPVMLEHLPAASTADLWRTMSSSKLEDLFVKREKLPLAAAH
jgi:hypothetical protein